MKQLDFPTLRQTYGYDCGAAALQTILAYYGLNIRGELIIKLAKTNKKKGTSISGMLYVLKKYNLQFDAKKMSMATLKNYLNKKIPVILLLQAWNGKPIDYTSDFKDGHWVVLVGYDKQKFIFEDPYVFEHTFLTEQELKKRWHSEQNGKKIFNYGIAVYGKEPVYNSKKIIHLD
ncbi:MAG: peptidase C39 family protein [Nanoarchaeota archaeon]